MTEVTNKYDSTAFVYFEIRPILLIPWHLSSSETSDRGACDCKLSFDVFDFKKRENILKAIIFFLLRRMSSFPRAELTLIHLSPMFNERFFSFKCWMDLLVILLHLLVLHLLCDRHYTTISISQRKQARRAFMELFDSCIAHFVPSVPKGKTNGRIENIRFCLLCGKSELVSLSKTHPFGRANPGVEK